MQPHMALIWQQAPVSYNGRFSLPGCSRNNCFEVTLAVSVVSCCTSVPFCQLKGYLDLLTVTKGLNRGQTFCTSSEWSFWDAHFTRGPALAERAQWFIKDRAVCHRHLLSDGHTKAWILGFTACYTADLEDLNVTVNYGGHEQASTVKSIHITQVTVNVQLASPDGFQFILSICVHGVVMFLMTNVPNV